MIHFKSRASLAFSLRKAGRSLDQGGRVEEVGSAESCRGGFWGGGCTKVEMELEGREVR